MFRGLAALVVLAFVVASSATAGTARLRIAKAEPLVLAGVRFESREAVRVTMKMNARTMIRTTRANARGTFSVSFGDVDYDRCRDRLSATARGREGSFATLKLPQLLCPPPLSP